MNNDETWKKKLTPEQYRVMRQGDTEPPFSGKYAHTQDKAVYRCAACGQELFSSEAKFDSSTGWPSFIEPMNREHVELREDLSDGMRRVEVRCSKCGSHLGHVFNDGPQDRSGKRYCINSVALELEKQPEAGAENP